MEEKIGRYHIVKQLHTTEMATVYLASDPQVTREVAIKVIADDRLADPAFQDRFDQEARLLLSLEHASIVPIYDYGRDGERPYLVMRYVKSGSLKDKLRKEGPRSPNEAADILQKLADALDYAHSRGVIHRDIKTANVLLNEQGHPYLTDFGIARLLDYTGEATEIGTPAYMAPEQWQRSRQIDTRLDVYQLGAMLYELLTGYPPFLANHREGYRQHHLHTPIPSVKQYNPTLSEQYDAIIARAMAKNPQERYAKATDLAAAFHQAVAAAVGAETVAPESTSDERSDTAAGSRLLAGGLGLVLLILLIGAAINQNGSWYDLLLGQIVSSTPTMTPTVNSQAEETAVGIVDPPPVAETATATPLPSATATPQPSATATATAQPSATPSPSSTATATPPPTATATPSPTATLIPSQPPPNAAPSHTWIRPADQMVMVFVPGGSTVIGSTDEAVTAVLSGCQAVRGAAGCQASWYEASRPPYPVTLSGYWLDRYAVTNRQYQQCVAAGLCQAPAAVNNSWYGEPLYADYPVVNVTWHDAEAYCHWAEAVLPTEAQWEYGARGPQSLLFPWGNEFEAGRANFCDSDCPHSWREAAYQDGFATLAPVGSYPAGSSWIGALDMAGNIWEWVSDWYAPYPTAPQQDPTGPTAGQERVLRGGSWTSNHWFLHSGYRRSAVSSSYNNDVGFRCVVPITP